MNTHTYFGECTRSPGARPGGAGIAFFTLLLMSTALAEGNARSGMDVVNDVCAACHAAGVEGAPQIGDSKAWSERASQGLSNLTLHALKGIREMPAHGGHPELSDLEIARAITHMVNLSGGTWIAPVSASELSAERSGKQVVDAQCTRCHGEGLNGAPKIGDLDAWVERIKLGFGYLVRSAIRGHGGMPPRGGRADLTDNEIRNAIHYMYYPAGAAARPSAAAQQAERVAIEDTNHQSVEGLEIYVGYMPVERLRTLPEGSPEHTMHGGLPQGPGYYHINVSLYDQESHAPVTGAKVRVRLDHSRLTGATSELQPMAIGGYGLFVRPVPRARYVIALHIQRPGTGDAVEAEFEHRFE